MCCRVVTYLCVLVVISLCYLQVALEKLFYFATSHVFESEVSGRMCADMCSAAAKVSCLHKWVHVDIYTHTVGSCFLCVLWLTVHLHCAIVATVKGGLTWILHLPTALYLTFYLNTGMDIQSEQLQIWHSQKEQQGQMCMLLQSLGKHVTVAQAKRSDALN